MDRTGRSARAAFGIEVGPIARKPPMYVKLVVPVALSIGAGVGLGSIPFVNEHLGWNL